VTERPSSITLAVLRLTLTDFRSYPALRLETDVRPVVLTGPNGAGKTNILEALSFLSPGRGLRRAKLSDVARREMGSEAPWALAALIQRGAERIEIGTGRDAGSERRRVRIEGDEAKGQQALAEVIGTNWLTPAMDRLFLEGASGRRRFFDRLVLGFDPGHASRSAAYEHAMRERTRLLRAGGADPAWLDALEATMAAKGSAIAAARADVASRLDAACSQGIGPFPAAGIRIDGRLETWVAEGGDAEARFRALLREARRRDEAAGAATEGPHRSDLKVRHIPKGMPAEMCSTGEQKAVLIAIILAQARVRQAETGMPPILLLDEVAAHLDEERRAALFDELCALGAQSWLTGTDAALFAAFGDRAQAFRVEGGALARA
jgi:DNA replication and repair protein RecF